MLLNRSDIDTTAEIGLDFWVFLFTAGIALLTGLATGLVPAWQAARADLTVGLKESGRSNTANRSQRRFRSSLVMVEVALSVILLVSAGLLLRSFAELRRVNPGVHVDSILTVGLSLPDAHYSNREQMSGFARRLLGESEGTSGSALGRFGFLFARGRLLRRSDFQYRRTTTASGRIPLRAPSRR